MQSDDITLTFDADFSGTLRSSECVDCYHLVFPAVIWAYSENVHGADAMGIGDVVVFVAIDTDVVQVPEDIGRGTTTDSTGHETLVAFWWSMDFQRHQDGWRPL